MALDYDQMRAVNDPRLHCPKAYSRPHYPIDQRSSIIAGHPMPAEQDGERHLFHEWRPFDFSGAPRAMCIHCRSVGEMASSLSAMVLPIVRDD